MPPHSNDTKGQTTLERHERKMVLCTSVISVPPPRFWRRRKKADFKIETIHALPGVIPELFAPPPAAAEEEAGGAAPSAADALSASPPPAVGS